MGKEKNYAVFGGVLLLLFSLVLVASNYHGLSSGTGKVTSTTGDLVVTSDPTGSQVRVDNVVKGVTPLTVADLIPGSHTLTVTPPSTFGCRSYVKSVPITAGQTTTVPATFVSTGLLKMSTTPFGASMYLNNAKIGTITPFSYCANAGSQLLKFTLSSYQDNTQTVNVLQGQTTTVAATLVPIPIPTTGTLTVNSNPASKVYVDVSTSYDMAGTQSRMPKGTTPFSSTLTNGVHNVLVGGIQGYQNYTTTVTINGGQTTDLGTISLLSNPVLSVSSTPSGARINLQTIEGSWMNWFGNTPSTISALSPNTYTLKLTLTGYRDYIQTISMVAGQTTNVDAVFMPA